MILALGKLRVHQWTTEPFRLWTLTAVLLVAALGSTKDIRPNIVAEVPTLDIGPVIVVKVIEGSAARLPCRHPHYPEDTLNLVLWYLDHSTRPFLSHDARSLDKNGNMTKAKYPKSKKKPSPAVSKNSIRQNEVTKKNKRRRTLDFISQRSIRSLDSNADSRKDRKSLSSGGTTLIIRNVRDTDEAEYRCRIHFRQSPTWTQRLMLVVADDVETVVLKDSTGRTVNTQVGPLAEGANLTLTCQASHGTSDVESLWWFVEGQPLDTSWASAGEGIVVNRLAITVVQESYQNANITCNLVTTDKRNPNIAANITERSITIAMYYVPVAVMESDGGRALLGGGLELMEGQTLSFLCSVRADPPVYNLIWLHNGKGRDVGGRVLARDNSSLVISPVTRQDTGIYACLASNSEGDGHSNAIPVVVKHLPYCSGPSHQKLTVTANTSVSLTCQVDAQPQDITFTWKIGIPALSQRHSQSAARSHQGSYGLFSEPETSHPIQRNSDSVARESSTDQKIGIPALFQRLSQSTKSHQASNGIYSDSETSHPIPHNSDSVAGGISTDLDKDGTSYLMWPRRGKLDSKSLPFVSNNLQIHLDTSGTQVASGDTDQAAYQKASGGRVLSRQEREDWKEGGQVFSRSGREEWKEVKHQRDPTQPGRSTVTLTPTASTVVGCYARNSVGHMEVPCTYAITVVEAPKALQDCNVTLIGITRMEVRCDDPIYAQDPSRDINLAMQDAQHSPSMSFVRSPESSTKANLEVWSGDTLVANVSEGRPIFSVRGLPPDAHLRLVLYTASSHSRSTPLYMYTKTQPRKHVHLSAAPPLQPPTMHPVAKTGLGIGTNLLEEVDWRLGGIMAGVMIMAVALLVGIIMWAWERFPPFSGRVQVPPRQLQHYPGITLDTLASEGSLSDETSIVAGGTHVESAQVNVSFEERQGVIPYGN
ncbi:uncharacterized protein [Palaemon carinicauda]|uniref:uncharacterized protein n=1 Tax=Palaemon carinicauda TaxID=392227 RepID=UPI0035B69A26